MSKRMILADDELYVRDALALMISDSFPDVEVVQVEDGESLVERVRDGGFALVLTDNQMPSVDGLEAIRQIRKFDGEVPIYMLSSSDKEREALEAGATGYIDKVHHRPQLPDVLKQYLG